MPPDRPDGAPDRHPRPRAAVLRRREAELRQAAAAAAGSAEKSATWSRSSSESVSPATSTTSSLAEIDDGIAAVERRHAQPDPPERTALAWPSASKSVSLPRRASAPSSVNRSVARSRARRAARPLRRPFGRGRRPRARRDRASAVHTARIAARSTAARSTFLASTALQLGFRHLRATLDVQCPRLLVELVTRRPFGRPSRREAAAAAEEMSVRERDDSLASPFRALSLLTVRAAISFLAAGRPAILQAVANVLVLAFALVAPGF